MKAMPQSAKALKLVGDVHASNPGGREKVSLLNCLSMITPFPSLGPFSFFLVSFDDHIRIRVHMVSIDTDLSLC